MTAGNKFLTSISNITTTENNAVTYKSTLSKILDLFFHGAALRNERSEARIQEIFASAFKEDPETALRILFYIRDCRKGQGERRVFRVILKWLAENIPLWLSENLHLIPIFGRWDDLFALMGTRINDDVMDFIKNQFNADYKSMSQESKWTASLLAKWMPSENTSSKETIGLAKSFRKYLGLKSKEYRQRLSFMRGTLDIVERHMSSNEWKSIRYNSVPSNAFLLYRKAFKRHDMLRYAKYLEEVKKGTDKVNLTTLYPYDIVRKCLEHETDDGTLTILWDNLPDYVPAINGLVIADTSGSMHNHDSLPMHISISLALYISERNKCPLWKDHFITFSRNPVLHQIKGDTLKERIKCVNTGEVANTDLQAVFNLILDRAKESHISREDMPEILLIISDMEFDACTKNSTSTNFEEIERRYSEAGYERPHIIFWNVCSRNTQTPVTINDRGVTLLSGASPNIFSYALSKLSAIEMVHNVTNSERYSIIKYK